jgi:hypothetical protein
MAWVPQKTLPINGVFDLVTNGKWFVARTNHAITCFDRKSQHITWQVQLNDDFPFGYKRLVLTNDVLLFVFHQADEIILLAAHSVVNGNKLWERPLQWSLTENLGGIHVIHQHVIFVEEGENEPQLVALSLYTGRELSIQNFVEVESYSPHRTGPHMATTTDDSVFFTLKGGGLCRVNLFENRVQWASLLTGSTGFVTSYRQQIYTVQWNHLPALLTFQDDTDSDLERFLLSPIDEVKDIIALQTNSVEQVVILGADDMGIGLFDITASEYLWQYRSNQLSIDDVCWTPHGLITLGQREGERMVNSLDTHSGVFLEQVLVEGAIMPFIHWHENTLYIDSSRGLQLFLFDDDMKN